MYLLIHVGIKVNLYLQKNGGEGAIVSHCISEAAGTMCIGFSSLIVWYKSDNTPYTLLFCNTLGCGGEIYKDKCVILETQSKRWDDAVTYCETRHGGSLITVLNQEDLDLMFAVMEWVGYKTLWIWNSILLTMILDKMITTIKNDINTIDTVIDTVTFIVSYTDVMMEMMIVEVMIHSRPMWGLTFDYPWNG